MFSNDGHTAVQSSLNALTAGNPQRRNSGGADKQHILTVPNNFSREQVESHVSDALESVEENIRVAIFEPSLGSDHPTLIISHAHGEFTLTQVESDSTEASERDFSVTPLVDTLTSTTRGKFYTIPSIGGCQAEVLKTI